MIYIIETLFQHHNFRFIGIIKGVYSFINCKIKGLTKIVYVLESGMFKIEKWNMQHELQLGIQLARQQLLCVFHVSRSIKYTYTWLDLIIHT